MGPAIGIARTARLSDGKQTGCTRNQTEPLVEAVGTHGPSRLRAMEALSHSEPTFFRGVAQHLAPDVSNQREAREIGEKPAFEVRTGQLIIEQIRRPSRQVLTQHPAREIDHVLTE